MPTPFEEIFVDRFSAGKLVSPELMVVALVEIDGAPPICDSYPSSDGTISTGAKSRDSSYDIAATDG